MGFITGLYSFLGGASEQFRTEIDTANRNKILEAQAQAERQAQLTKDIQDQANFEKELAFEIDKFAFDKHKFEVEQGVAKDKWMSELAQWEKNYLLNLDEFKLKQKDIENKIKLAQSEDERAELYRQLENEKFGWQQKQDKIKNELDIDENQWKKDIAYLEYSNDTMKELEKSKKGTRSYSDDLSFNPKDYTEKERPNAFLAWADLNLTKEKIDSLDEEGKLKLKQDFDSYHRLLLKDLAFTTPGAEGQYLDTLGPNGLGNAMAMGDYLGVSLKEGIKQKAIQDAQANGVKADDVIVNSDIVEQSDGSTVPIITTKVVNYEELAKNNDFESKDQLVSSIDNLVAIGKKQSSAVFSTLEPNLSPFRDRAALVAELNNREIPLSILKLGKFYNDIQESTFDKVKVSTNYDAMITAAFSEGILTVDATGRIHGEEQLIDFLHLVQPEFEYSRRKSGKFQVASSSVDAYNQQDKIKPNDMRAQNEAANQALGTTRQLKEVVNRNDSGDLLGASLNIATSLYGGIQQAGSLSNLFSGTTNKFGQRLRTGDGTSNAETGGLSSEKLNEITKQIDDANSILSDDTLSAAAKKKAQLTLLKFTLAYQVSMALQGGSGGRTISDQDVDNILNSLALTENYFSFDTKEKTTAALDTLEEFLETIALRTKYADQNTMKALRTYDATVEILNSISKNGGISSSPEGLKEGMMERADVGLAIDQDVDKAYNPSTYQKQWAIVAGNNNTPVYVERKKDGYGFDPLTARYIPADVYNEMVKELNIPDTSQLQVQPFSDGLEYKGMAVKNILGQ